MKILFCALHFGYFRNFESVICALAERGHQLHLAAEEPERFGGQELMERLAAAYPTITWGWLPDRTQEAWVPLARHLRYSIEYLRFLGPRHDGHSKLRERAELRASRALLALLRLPLGDTRRARRFVQRTLMCLEYLMPPSYVAEEFLETQQPDVLLLASLTYSRSQQADYLQAAQRRGIRTAACVMGFDHLSSKALLNSVPDRVIVWNDIQRREATELHGISAERIIVTGAQCYDHWFQRRPSRSREEFCRAVGLAPERPFVLYVCSAMSPDPHESAFVLEWVSRIRASGDPSLREAGILIRPHPERTRDWTDVDLSQLPNVVLHGRNPIDPAAKSDYYDALYHSSAVVGLVTSAFLEAAVVGRPVCTLLLPTFRPHQEGMQHFGYLLEIEGGLLQAVRTFDEHLAQLMVALDGRPPRSAQTARFLEAFIRPGGLDVPATPVFVEAVEQLGAVAPTRVPMWARLLQPVGSPLALLACHRRLEPLWMDSFEIAIARREATNRRRKQAYIRAKDALERRIDVDKQHRLRLKQRHRRHKVWRKRLRTSPRKLAALVKGRVKQIIGTEAR